MAVVTWGELIGNDVVVGSKMRGCPLITEEKNASGLDYEEVNRR